MTSSTQCLLRSNPWNASGTAEKPDQSYKRPAPPSRWQISPQVSSRGVLRTIKSQHDIVTPPEEPTDFRMSSGQTDFSDKLARCCGERSTSVDLRTTQRRRSGNLRGDCLLSAADARNCPRNHQNLRKKVVISYHRRKGPGILLVRCTGQGFSSESCPICAKGCGYLASTRVQPVTRDACAKGRNAPTGRKHWS